MHMNLHRFFSQAAVLIGAVLFSTGLQAFAFTQPSTSPPNADAYAPLNTGPSVQTKLGGLLLNMGGAQNGLIVQFGNVGIGTVNPAYKLDVSGSANFTSGVKIGNDSSACTASNFGTLRSVDGSLQFCGTVTVYVPGNSACNDRCSGGIYYGDISLYGTCKVYSCGYPRQQYGWGTVTLK